MYSFFHDFIYNKAMKTLAQLSTYEKRDKSQKNCYVTSQFIQY